ncbi:MAG: response regulator, partial [Prochloraceae cyanobacterium]
APGVGMSQTHLSKNLQPFEQVGDVKSRAEGTGLGLSISERLVKLMGGKLQVKSKLGVGSTFWFDIVLPVLQKSTKYKPQIVKQETIIIDPDSKPKILIVDDKQVNRDLLVALLKPKGFEIFTANNGEQMLEMAALIQPDLILLDLFMPVKTGFTSAKELRKNPKFKDIPIIVITASTITKEISSYLDCEAVLHKPIDEEQLFASLQKYLSKNPERSLKDIAG